MPNQQNPTYVAPDSREHSSSSEEDRGSIFVVEGRLVLAMGLSDCSLLDATSWGVRTRTGINSNMCSKYSQFSSPTNREASVSVKRIKMVFLFFLE